MPEHEIATESVSHGFCACGCGKALSGGRRGRLYVSDYHRWRAASKRVRDRAARAQLTLPAPLPSPKLTLDEQFQQFHEAHPEVERELTRLARLAKAQDKRVGIKCLWEVMRFNFWMRLDETEEFKLNNNYTSRYARLLMELHADLEGYFELRRLR